MNIYISKEHLIAALGILFLISFIVNIVQSIAILKSRKSSSQNDANKSPLDNVFKDRRNNGDFAPYEARAMLQRKNKK